MDGWRNPFIYLRESEGPNLEEEKKGLASDEQIRQHLFTKIKFNLK